MTRILALDTATEACSAALLQSDGTTQKIVERFEIAPRAHTQRIFPMLDEVLAEANCTLAEVDAIAFGQGPGAFTGLRIATGIAQGLALSVDKPLIGISSLAALALATNATDQKIFAAIDARMNEVYWGEFTLTAAGKIETLEEEKLSAPEQLFDSVRQRNAANTTLVGSGWDAYFDTFSQTNATQARSQQKLITNQFPAAAYIARLAYSAYKDDKLLNAAEAQPVYLRNNVAEKPRNMA